MRNSNCEMRNAFVCENDFNIGAESSQRQSKGISRFQISKADGPETHTQWIEGRAAWGVGSWKILTAFNCAANCANLV